MRIPLPSMFIVLALSSGPQLWAQDAGPWHTSGNQILDSTNKTVRISGVNWYGFETTDEVVHGLWAQDYRAILNTIRANGYNTIRLPFSNQMVENPVIPSNISHNNNGGAINTDLAGLNSLQILDKIIAYAGQLGLKVILDNHRSEAGNSAEGNGLWYTSAYPESAWINDWLLLANRYKGNATVVGADLRNEPHNSTSGGSCWGCGSTTNDWRLAAQRGGNAVLSANPAWLIFVEGTDCYKGDCDWWGGNLEGAKDYPVSLNSANRLVYSAHDYGPHEYGQSWFNGSTTYSSLSAVWTKFWAYLSLNGTAPVWVGEFGTTNNSSDVSNSAGGSQGQWFQSIVAFLKANPNISWTYWALNGEDNYGILDAQYDSKPANSDKQQALASIQSSGGVAPVCPSAPQSPTALTLSVVSPTQINLTWGPGSAAPGCHVTYDVYASESQNFPVSASTLIVSGRGSTSYSASGLASNTTYYFAVTALDSVGQSSPSAQRGATTQASTVQPPASPSDLSAVATSSSTITLTWHVSASSPVTYNVYRSPNPNFTPAAALRIASGVTGASYTNAGLPASTTYYFLVTAIGKAESLPSNQASATTQAASHGSCHVVYTVNSQWNDGFNVGISIQNTGSAALSSWALTWTWSSSQSISQAWNSNLVSSAPKVVLTNASWNGSIAPGATVGGVGFNGNYSGTSPAPATFYLNGMMCQ